MAARGYFQAFREVRMSVERVLKGASAAETVERDHPTWYQERFSPSVLAGLAPAAALAGYRSTAVYVCGSRYVPPAANSVPHCMDAYLNCLKSESHPGVRAVLGHFLFVYIHPYPDGNGRMGRFLMNVLLAAGGYPWTIIRLSRRREYMSALDAASVGNQIGAFVDFVKEEMSVPPHLVSGER